MKKAAVFGGGGGGRDDDDNDDDEEEYPAGSEMMRVVVKEYLQKLNKMNYFSECIQKLNPQKLEEGAKKYSRGKKDKNAPEWRLNATPYLLREHWRYQVCQRLNVDKKDLPESVTEALRAYLFPSALDTQRANHRAWLVKVPNFVDRAWKNFNEKRSKIDNDDDDGMDVDGAELNDNDELGKVRVVVDPFSKENDDAFAVTLNQGVNEGEDINQRIPVEYVMTENPDAPEIHVFSETREGTAAATSAMDANEFIVEAKVHKKLDMRPKDASDVAYARVSKERMEKAQSKSRFVQSVVGADATRIAPLPKRSNLIRLADGSTTKPKVERMEKHELENKLFTLFERRTFWSLKQLLAETRQPAMYLKQTVQEIANLARRGPNTGMYSLKGMYKQQQQQPSALENPTST